MNINNLRTTQDFIKYWQRCITNPNNQPDTEVAYNMVRVMASDAWEDLYRGKKADKDFTTLFDLVSELEIDQGNAEWRKQTWEKVTILLKKLQKKYRTGNL